MAHEKVNTSLIKIFTYLEQLKFAKKQFKRAISLEKILSAYII